MAFYYFSKKRKVLFMLSALKELGVIKWKERDPLEDKEKINDYHQNRLKFTEDNNAKIKYLSRQITPWKIRYAE